jgi:hypothetical protein
MTLAAAFVVLLLVRIYKSTRKPDKFPPGPPRLPVVGGLPYLVGSSQKSSLLVEIL